MPTWTKEQSEAIYSSGTNILVSAGAGSGKTAVLTTRVIEKLKSGVHINELLILTFTKAAAGEMKERIRKKIKQDETLKQELSLLDSAYITTFDAFSLSIVKKYHYLLNITSSPKIADDSVLEILKRDTLRKILDSYYEKEQIDFTNFIGEYCVKNDDEIYNSLLNIAKKIENSFTEEHYLEDYIQNNFQEETIEKYLQEFELLIIEKQTKIKENLEELARISPNDYMTKCYQQLEGLLNAKDIDTLNSYRSCKMPPLKKGSEEEIKEAKEIVNNSIKELLALLEYGNIETLRQDYQKMSQTISLFCQILKEYFEELKIQKKKKEYYDFNDIAKLAIHLVKKEQEVRTNLKNGFHEIMIDEYQDTNNIQETFISYIANNNVYMVGDIKQSIYRFRNANPALFKTKYDTYRTNLGGKKIDLLKNFRSRKEVLEDINRMFNQIMDDALGGANYLEEHQMVFGNSAYIENGTTKENYHMDILSYQKEKKSDYKEEEIEAFLIAEDIHSKIKNGYLLYDKDEGKIHKATYKDFVILMDRSTNFNLYKQIFNAKNIPLNIQKDEKLNDSTIFVTFTNLLQTINSFSIKQFDKKFEFAYTSVARSFLFEIPDQTIYETITTHNWYQTAIYKQLKEIIETISTQTLPNIISKLYETTNIYEKIIKIGNIEENLVILNYIQDLAKEYGQKANNIFTFHEFLNRIQKDELEIRFSTNETNEDSVTIMTIHKSKGLEYPICYFSGLTKKFNIRDVKERFLYDSKYGFLTPLKQEGIYTCFLKELIKQNYIKEEISEKIRLFYVAVTRAKEKMIFVLPEKEKEINTRIECRSLADFLYIIWPYLKDFQTKIKQEEIKLTKDYLTETQGMKISPEITEPILVEEIHFETIEEPQLKFSKDNNNLITKKEAENIKLGIKMHEYLECIDFINPNYDQIANAFLKKKIRNFIESEFIQQNKDYNIQKEYEFIYEKDQKEYHGMIDLLIETPTKIIILDYKLNHLVDDAYIKQLKGYKSYIETKTSKPISLYLYSILKEEFISLEKELTMV